MNDLIPISDIIIGKRLRDKEHSHTDLESHLEGLMDSIKRYGLLQPPLIDENNVLQDGWCRTTAWKQLALEDPEKYALIPVYRRNKLSEAEYYELELETNIRRLNLNWRETVVSVCRIHRARTMEARAQGKDWTQEMTGVLLGGYSKSYVSNCVMLISGIKPDGKDRYAECESITDALRIYYRSQEDAAIAEQARRTGLVQPVTPTTLYDDDGHPEPNTISNLLVSDDEDLPADEVPHMVDLSGSLFLGDSIRCILPEWPINCVDHIITDPPYGIDMDNLNQTDTGYADIARTAEEHGVAENESLFLSMFTECHRVLRDGGFMILWCDAMQWQNLYNLAIKADFSVQRWPLIWCKPSGLNQMAHINVTKATEFVMVCRKGKAQLPNPVSSNWFIGSNDAAKLSNPFAKPFGVWRVLYECFTTPGQTVLDPFAGEGSSVISGLKMNRRVLAIEKVETHFNYMIEQVKDQWKSVYKNVNFQ